VRIALGLDWSGAQNAGRKIWAARVALDNPNGSSAVLELWRPFAGLPSPRAVAEAFGQWLAEQEFDVAGLDFCFGLHASHMAALGLPTIGPAAAGAALLQSFAHADEFTAAVGGELRRQTDRQCRAPFAPTNWRMYRQTFWGLAALAHVSDPFPPWDPPGPRSVVEVLPALLARKLCPGVPYKAPGPAGRERLLTELERRFGLRVNAQQRGDMLTDAQGDAIDAVLAALTAGAVLAAGFEGAPEAARQSGEGWIYAA
jgi:hypothetical protein